MSSHEPSGARQREWRDLAQRLLPEPVREDEGHIELPKGYWKPLWGWFGGDPGEVIVHGSAKGLTVSLYTVYWGGPCKSKARAKAFARVEWSDLPDNDAEAEQVLRDLFEAARTVRRASFSTCRYCHELIPPERMYERDVCHSCAERHLGVVF